jgi:hypothetical protein
MVDPKIAVFRPSELRKPRALAAEGAKVARWSALTSSANNPT